MNNNKINYNQQTNKQKFYNEQRLTNTNIPNNNQIFKGINIDNQRNTYYGNNNKFMNSYFDIKNIPQVTQGKNINFNQEIKNVEVQNNNQEIAVVTKITDNSDIKESQDKNLIYEQYLSGINNNINKKILNKNIPLDNNNKININFIQNNINNINIKAPTDSINKKTQDNYIPEDIDKLINENIKKYLSNPKPNANIPTVHTITNLNNLQQIPSGKNQKLINSYGISSNTIIPNNKILNTQDLNNLVLFSNPDKNQINNNYITYNKPETERFTVTDDKIQSSEKPLVNKDVAVTYNDFDGSGFVKNYGGVSRPGKDSSGKQKTNQDALVCQTNINNIKDFNIFGVLDGHGPEGHYVSQI